MRQLNIEFSTRFTTAVAWEQLLRIIVEIVNEVGAKEVANACDRAPSSFDAALVERDRHRLRGRDVLTIALLDKQRKIVHFLAELVDCDLAPRKRLSEDERNRAIVAQLRTEASGYLADLEKRALR